MSGFCQKDGFSHTSDTKHAQFEAAKYLVVGVVSIGFRCLSRNLKTGRTISFFQDGRFAMAKTLQLSVLGELLQYIRPKTVSDWGPELPNVHPEKVGNLVSLNPQPLPPLANFAETTSFAHRRPEVHEIAGLFLNRMLVRLDSLEYRSKDDQKQAVQLMSRQAGILAEWCGTVPVNERIRELLAKLRWRFPPIPDPEPHPNWQSLLITAGLFAHAATIAGHEELSAALNKGAERILDSGIKTGGLSQIQGIAA
jgi:hypothetical protein